MNRAAQSIVGTGLIAEVEKFIGAPAILKVAA